ncbi:MAG: sigma-70 family RNA polymerase sigma factor [Phycisphaeraceae bacterium]|nr:sigma-70 family RNA polymerase sigma factor [Phycisphaeraceae bacterium]
MPDDQLLLARLKNGDRQALACLYHRYKCDLLTLAVFLLADVAAAEDVLHDVFVTFAGAVRRLNVRGSLRSYLVSCIVNRARDEQRRRGRQTIGVEDFQVAPDTSGPLDNAIELEDAGRLAQALAQLPYEQREVISLHLHGDLTFRQIGSQLGISINTTTSRYRYGLEKLRSLLAGVSP